MKKFKDIIAEEKPVLVDFYADWCAPCKMMPPILKEVKAQLSDQVRVIKVDVDKNPQIAAAFGIQSIPTMILFKNGEAKWRQTGVSNAQNLLKVVQNYMD